MQRLKIGELGFFKYLLQCARDCQFSKNTLIYKCLFFCSNFPFFGVYMSYS